MPGVWSRDPAPLQLGANPRRTDTARSRPPTRSGSAVTVPRSCSTVRSTATRSTPSANPDPIRQTTMPKMKIKKQRPSGVKVTPTQEWRFLPEGLRPNAPDLRTVVPGLLGDQADPSRGHRRGRTCRRQRPHPRWRDRAVAAVPRLWRDRTSGAMTTRLAPTAAPTPRSPSADSSEGVPSLLATRNASAADACSSSARTTCSRIAAAQLGTPMSEPQRLGFSRSYVPSWRRGSPPTPQPVGAHALYQPGRQILSTASSGRRANGTAGPNCSASTAEKAPGASPRASPSRQGTTLRQAWHAMPCWTSTDIVSHAHPF